MTYREAVSIVERLTYKYGWTFSISRALDMDAVEFRIWFLAPDADAPERVERISGCETFVGEVFKHWNQKQFLEILRKSIHRMELHESDEFIRFDKQKIFCPHAAHEVIVLKGLYTDDSMLPSIPPGGISRRFSNS